MNKPTHWTITLAIAELKKRIKSGGTDCDIIRDIAKHYSSFYSQEEDVYEDLVSILYFILDGYYWGKETSGKE